MLNDLMFFCAFGALMLLLGVMVVVTDKTVADAI